MKVKRTIRSRKRPARTKIGSRIKKAVMNDSLTKSVLESAAKKGVGEAAQETMDVMGYNLIAVDGWLFKIFPDKRVEKISRIA